jgi:serine/threonine-protein kinase
VSLVVSSGVPRVTVPNIVGRPLTDARRLLAEAGLQLGPVAVDSSAVALPNTVLLQDPGAGETAGAGGEVRITVAGIR